MLIYHTFQVINACSKVFVECIICFGELDKISPFQLAPLTPKASPNTKKLKRTCI